MFNPLDILHEKFNKLTVVRYNGVNNKHKHIYECCCECGNIKTTDRRALLTGHTGSCGCYFRSVCWRNRVTHGETIKGLSGKFNNPEYRAWSSMKERCENPMHASYHNYGGRGITVSPEWSVDFLAFLKSIGKRPSKAHSLERINNSLGYFEVNVKWATIAEQSNNRRTNIVIEFDGEHKTMSQWAAQVGLSKEVVSGRLKRGWSIGDALSRPVLKKTVNRKALYVTEPIMAELSEQEQEVVKGLMV